MILNNNVFLKQVPTALRQLIPNASPDGVEIMYAMLAWNPQQRPSSHKALAHRFFTVGQNLHRKPQKPNNNKPIPSDILEKNNTQETVKPINLNMSLNKNLPSKKTNMDFEPKMPDGPKKMPDTRKRWGSSTVKQNGAAVKDSMDEFDSILDGLGSSTNSFNKRVRFYYYCCCWFYSYCCYCSVLSSVMFLCYCHQKLVIVQRELY